jgi:hypothetical protein
MTDKKDRMDGHDALARPAERDIVLELNFVPAWARKPPAQGAFDAPVVQDARRPVRRPRPDRRDERTDRRKPSAARSARPAVRRAEPVRGGPCSETEPSKEPAPVDVRFLPEQKRLSAVIREIAATKRSYPLMAVASLFLSDARNCLVRLAWLPEAGKRTFCQCAFCKVAATGEESLVDHIVHAHLGHVFRREEIEVEPPVGNFACVARLGRGGPIVAPPNHHSYSPCLRELHEQLDPGMPLDAFEAGLEMDHSTEAIEQWKAESRRQVVYYLRDAAGDSEPTPFTRAEAETHMRRHVAPKAVQHAGHIVMPASVARTIPDPSLMAAIRQAWDKEGRFPFTLSLALRGAFRHRHLHLFKAGPKAIFVTAVQPDPLDPEHTVDHIREILVFLADHPGCTREALVDGLRPGTEPDAEQRAALLAPLRWLIEKGHIIEFFNGTLSVPLRGGRHAVAAGRPPRVSRTPRKPRQKGNGR